MNTVESIAMNTEDVTWPEPTPVPAERVLNGSPVTSMVVVADSPNYQLGLWKVTPGAFASSHTGYIEFIHIIEGFGRLVDEDGSITLLQPGTTTLMPAGWQGRWEIDAPLTKVFSIIQL